MQSIEFSTQISNGNIIEVPTAVSKFLKKQKQIRVVLYIEDDEDETPINGLAIMSILPQTTSFDFLKEDEEDIYTDNDLKIKY